MRIRLVNIETYEKFYVEDYNEAKEFLLDVYNIVHMYNKKIKMTDILDQYEIYGLTIVGTVDLYNELINIIME